MRISHGLVLHLGPWPCLVSLARTMLHGTHLARACRSSSARPRRRARRRGGGGAAPYIRRSIWQSSLFLISGYRQCELKAVETRETERPTATRNAQRHNAPTSSSTARSCCRNEARASRPASSAAPPPSVANRVALASSGGCSAAARPPSAASCFRLSCGCEGGCVVSSSRSTP